MSQQVAVTVRYREVPLMRRAVVDNVDESGGFLHTDVPMPVGSVVELAPADGAQGDGEIERVTARVEQVVEQPRRQQQDDSKRPGMRLRFTSEAGVEALLATAGELAIELAEPEAVGGKRRTYHANAPAFRTASRAEAAALRHIATAEAQAELLRQNDADADEDADGSAADDGASSPDGAADDAQHDSDNTEGYGESADATEVAARPAGLDAAATVIDAAPAADEPQQADAYVFEAAEPDESDVPSAQMMRFGRDPTGDTPMLASASGEIGGPQQAEEAETSPREDTERIEAAELEADAGTDDEARADEQADGEQATARAADGEQATARADDDEQADDEQADDEQATARADDGVVGELRARRKTQFYGAVEVSKGDDSADDGDDSGDDDSGDDDSADGDSGGGGGGGDDESETTSSTSKRRRKRRGRKRKR